MIPSTPKLMLGVVALALVAAGCSSATADEATTTSTTTTTMAPVTTIAEETTTTVAESTTSTSTTVPGLEIADSINGLPAEDALVDRRVVAVKVDNHPNARPQSGLEIADATYEILVEGGLTRFIALYHQSDAEYVGPNRSGRPTDAAVLAPFDPVFQVSGAQPWVQSVFRKEGTRIVYDNRYATYRISTRSAPQNLYVSTPRVREYADEVGWADDNPGNLFPYGEPTASDQQATRITTEFSDASPVVWEWDGERYLRFNGDEPHEWVTQEGETGQIAYDTVVAILGERYIVSPPSGSSGSSVPATRTVGEGAAFVFQNGTVVSGSWARETTADPFVLTTEDGSPIVIEPARIWISVVPDNRSVTWE